MTQGDTSASQVRRFERNDLAIECEPGRDITLRRGSSHSEFRFTLPEAHFVLTRLQEAMRVALEVQERDLR